MRQRDVPWGEAIGDGKARVAQAGEVQLAQVAGLVKHAAEEIVVMGRFLDIVLLDKGSARHAQRLEEQGLRGQIGASGIPHLCRQVAHPQLSQSSEA